MEGVPELIDDEKAFQEGEGEAKTFSEVRRKRKRDKESDMDVTEAHEVGLAPVKRPSFPPVATSITLSGRPEFRKVPVPPHRFTPLKESWMEIFTPVVDHLKLQVRLNLKTRNVEIKTSKFTTDSGAIQRAADFVRAFMLGFDVEDSLALVRLDDLFIDSFEVTDVKPLKGDHLSRAIGRIAGTGGKTKFTIENVTKTRIVLADSKIHLLGSFKNIRIARNAICSLIMDDESSYDEGEEIHAYRSRAPKEVAALSRAVTSEPIASSSSTSVDRLFVSADVSTNAEENQGQFQGTPPSKVYGTMRAVASRASECF